MLNEEDNGPRKIKDRRRGKGREMEENKDWGAYLR